MSSFSSNSSNSSSDWLIGIGLALLASLVGGGGRIIIRKSWILAEKHEQASGSNSGGGSSGSSETDDSNKKQKRQNFLAFLSWAWTKHKLYQLLTLSLPQYDVMILLRSAAVFVMTFVLPFIGLSAMYYAPPSIVTPITGLMLVWIVMSSPLLLNEYPTKNQIVASVFITVGNVLVALFGDHSSDRGKTVQEVMDSYTEVPLTVFHVAWVAWMAVVLNSIATTNHNNTDRCYRWFRIDQKLAWGFLGGSLRGMQHFIKDSLTIFKAVKSTVGEPPYKQTQFYFTLLFGGGSTQTATAVFGETFTDKVFCALEIMLSLPLLGYVLLLLNTIVTILSTMLMGACMKKYDALYSSAMFTGSGVVVTTIMSAIHYNTFSNLESTEKKILYPTGLALMLIGITILAVVQPNNIKPTTGNHNDAIPVQKKAWSRAKSEANKPSTPPKQR